MFMVIALRWESMASFYQTLRCLAAWLRGTAPALKPLVMPQSWVQTPLQPHCLLNHFWPEVDFIWVLQIQTTIEYFFYSITILSCCNFILVMLELYIQHSIVPSHRLINRIYYIVYNFRYMPSNACITLWTRWLIYSKCENDIHKCSPIGEMYIYEISKLRRNSLTSTTN